MEEERPLKDARGALESSGSGAMITADQSGNQEAARTYTGLMVVGIVLVVSLIIAGLFLPPISLGKRLSSSSNDAVSTERGAVSGEMTLHLQNAAIDVDVSAVTLSDLANDNETAAIAEKVPAIAEVKSNIYLIDYDGAAPRGSINVVIPENAGSSPVLDLYGWDGSAWTFIPTQGQEENQLVSALVDLPKAVALMETAAPESVAVAGELLPAHSLPAPIVPYLTEVSAGTLTLGENGALRGEVAEATSGDYVQYVRATNVGIVVDQASLVNVLADQMLLDQHVTELVAAASDYAGLNLDYQGVPSGQRQAFTDLVALLAEMLHANDKKLIVTLGTPVVDGAGRWETGGQNWQAIGKLADAVYVQMPLDPLAYAEDGLAQELVVWAVTQVYRHKLSLLVTTNAIDAVGGAFRELPNSQALANFGELSLVQGGEEVEVGTVIEVGLAGTASPLEWDGASMMYRYSYEQAGQEHAVWLNNESAVSRRMHFAAPYHLRGVVLRGISNVAEGEGYARAVESFVNAADAPEPTGAAIVWTVEDEDERVVASSSGEALSYRWENAEKPGRYTINAVFAQGDSVAKLGSLPIDVEPKSTPVPTPKPTEPVAVAEEATPSAPAAPTATTAPPVTSVDPGDADAATNIGINFRTGPGLSYSVTEVLPAGTKLTLIGRNAAGNWVQVRVQSSEKEGWLFASLLTISSSVDVNALAVVEVDPPTTSSGDTPAPPPPVANTGFELGGQTHTLANPTLMQEAGMNWVKFQHKWGPGDTPDAVAGRINHAHGNGMKVLLSIPGAATYPSSIDFNAYVEFLRGVAALGPDAIEIWNEMNIDFEWPAGQIDPNSYVNNMLKPAYQAIKSANPNVMVISGAPAPTGYDNGTNAWADDRYMAGVAAAGGANYMDCIGVHHNAGATPPNASSGHPAGNNHYSWYFVPTLNMYYNAFGGARPVCFTELGYLSGQDFGGVPSRFSWAAGTTVAQHAEWLGQAASLAGNSGKVRMLIVFNVDFTHWSEDPQAGYAILRPDGSCPACNTLRAAMGR